MHRLKGSLSHTSVPLRLFWRFASKSKPSPILTSSVALLCLAYIAFESRTLLAAQGDKGLKQKLLSEAPDAWGRWKEWTAHTESEFSEEELRRSSPGKPVSVDLLQYHLQGMTRRRHFFKTLPDGRKYEEIAIRRGDRYFFTAERYDDGQLVVTEVRPGPAPGDERTVPPVLEAPYTVYYRNLAELVKNPRFTFDVSAVDGKDPSERVRLTFKYDPKGEQIPRILEGWIELSPLQDWAVQEFLIKNPKGSFIGRRIQYGNGIGPQKPLVQVITSYLGLDGKSQGDQSVALFKKQMASQKPDEFFSFTAVGLSEPEPADDGTRCGLIEVRPKTIRFP
jgi:hypothetical protein